MVKKADSPTPSKTVTTDVAPTTNGLDDLSCPCCDRPTRVIILLLRAPAANERRVCEKCVPQFEKDGLLVVGDRRQHGRTHEGALTCQGCGDHSNHTFIMSPTGTPADAKVCDECATKLKSEGWRATSVYART